MEQLYNGYLLKKLWQKMQRRFQKSVSWAGRRGSVSVTRAVKPTSWLFDEWRGFCMRCHVTCLSRSIYFISELTITFPGGQIWFFYEYAWWNIQHLFCFCFFFQHILNSSLYYISLYSPQCVHINNIENKHIYTRKFGKSKHEHITTL